MTECNDYVALSAELNKISTKIKEVENSFSDNPFEFTVSFHEIGEDCFLGWLSCPNNTRKKRLTVVFEDKERRPLIECKAGIRILSERAVNELKETAKSVCANVLKKLKSREESEND